MTYLINPEARGVDDPSRVWDRGWCRHVPDHVFLACPLSTLLRAICRPLPPGCEFWCGRVVLLTRRAVSRSSSAASPLSTSCEGWVGACTTRFLTWGYHNIHIREGDEWKGAIVTNRGLYEPKVMYFGMTNSPATFQAL